MLPPGPRSPAVVQMIEFSTRPVQMMESAARKYGDPFTMRMPALGAYVMISAPPLIKEVFNGDPDLMHAGKANQVIEPLVGSRSVLLLDGTPHLRARRLLSPPMRGERMQAYASIIEEITLAELARMPVGRPFSIHAHMQAITLDVILRAVFGLERGPHMDRFRAVLVELLEPPPAVMTFVPKKWLDFPGSPYRTFLRRKAAVDRALLELVDARRSAPLGEDILSLLLAARDETGAPLSDEELRDELITMLLAGHETTATALSWAVALILQAPDVRDRLGDPDYLDATIKETLRLRPIVPDVVRELQRPMTFAGYDLPAGAKLTPCIYLAHRRPDIYPEPSRFDPTRFLGVKPDPYAWFPFGGGIRRCLGMAFALYEMRVVLSLLFARAKLRLAQPGPVRVVRRTVTLAPAGGTRVILDAPVRDRFS